MGKGEGERRKNEVKSSSLPKTFDDDCRSRSEKDRISPSKRDPTAKFNRPDLHAYVIFYYNDQNPPGFCFHVQIRTFII